LCLYDRLLDDVIHHTIGRDRFTQHPNRECQYQDDEIHLYIHDRSKKNEEEYWHADTDDNTDPRDYDKTYPKIVLNCCRGEYEIHIK